MTEQQLQSECFKWFWNEYPEQRGMLFHADNNSSNSIIGNQKKSLGVVKGVSDFILIVENAVVFIEMKTEIGILSPAQREFKEKVLDRGHIHIVIRTVEQFKNKIWNIIGKK